MKNNLTLMISGWLLTFSAAVYAAKQPVPSEADQHQALALVKEIYGKKHQDAKTAEQKITLANILLQKAFESKSDPPSHFVLLKLAQDVAASAGEVELALKAVEETIAAFDVKALATKYDVLSKIAPCVRTQKQNEDLLRSTITFMDESVSEDAFETAETIAILVRGASNELRPKELTSRLAAKLTEIKEIAAEYAKAKEAVALLKQQPTDSALNLTAGKYYCFWKGKWDQGLTVLALGSDDELKTLAMQELTDVTDVNEQMKLADSWWALAETQSGHSKEVIQGRATHWYRRALPNLRGLIKDKAERRLATFDGNSIPKVPVGSRPEASRPSSTEEGWISLFDGRSLKGWQADQNPQVWAVVDGAIVGSGGSSIIYYMPRTLYNFEAKSDVKINSMGNSGFFFRSIAPLLREKNPGPRAYEVQIVGSNAPATNGNFAGSLYKMMPVSKNVIGDDAWFTLHLIARGKQIKVYIDGNQVADYIETSASHGGRIALQCHKTGTRVSFKNLMVKPLP